MGRLGKHNPAVKSQTDVPLYALGTISRKLYSCMHVTLGHHTYVCMFQGYSREDAAEEPAEILRVRGELVQKGRRWRYPLHININSSFAVVLQTRNIHNNTLLHETAILEPM